MTSSSNTACGEPPGGGPDPFTPRLPGAGQPALPLPGRTARLYRLAMEIDKDPASPGAATPGEPVSPIEVRLDPRSGVPTYLQLVQQVEHALRLGYLRVGDQLPRVKDVVGSISINPNTVLKAYRELEHKGLAIGRPGQGTFVIGAPEPIEPERLAALRARLLDGWLQEAAAAGLDEDGMLAVFASAVRELRDARLPDTDRRRGRGVVA